MTKLRRLLLLIEWQLWCSAAMAYESGIGKSGVCVEIGWYWTPAWVMENALGRARRFLPPRRHRVDYDPPRFAWPPYAQAPRARFCWQMAEEVEKEMNR